MSSLLYVTDGAEGVPAREAHAACLLPWYALRVRSNHERTVQSDLRERCIEEFLPSYQSVKKWSDRTKITERPLFPGYIFARFLDVPTVLSVNGVCGVLGGNLTPATISAAEIESVKLVVSSLLPVQPIELLPSAFAAGDRVTINEGALRGCTGFVQRHAKGTRLIVTIEMLHRGVAVEIEAGVLAKVS